MIKLKTKIEFDDSKLKTKQEQSKQAAQMQLDQDVLKDSNYFIPKETGELERSSLRHSRIGQGHIEWKAPQARRLYYNPQYNFSKDVNPNAQGLWFEAAKALKRPNWMQNIGNKYAKYFNGK
jgi:Minor capsid protein